MVLVNENVTQSCQSRPYKRSQQLIQSLRVVNNLAESYVALTHEFNSSLKGDEEQKQLSPPSH